MKIVKLKGGLGNQMFQYSYAKLLEKNTGDEVRLDFSAYKSLGNDAIRTPRIKKFNISLEEAENEDLKNVLYFQHKGNSLSFMYKVGIYLEKTINKKYVFEPNRAYIQPSCIEDGIYFDGYWQSYRYFEEVAETVRKDFTPNYELSDKTNKMIDKVRHENSVFIGIRRGDYHDSKYGERHFGVIPPTYYLNGMDYIEKRVKSPIYYVFTNDVEWCRNNIPFKNRNIVFRYPEDQTNDFEELMIMAACKHSIITNSTFNWWGANLEFNDKKIVCCPPKWFFDDKPIDIIPTDWIRIEL